MRGDIQILGRIRHDVQVILVGAQAFDDLSPIGDLELDFDVRVMLVETAQHARQKVLGRRHQGNAQLAALESLQVVNRRFKARPNIVKAAHRR